MSAQGRRKHEVASQCEPQHLGNGPIEPAVGSPLRLLGCPVGRYGSRPPANFHCQSPSPGAFCDRHRRLRIQDLPVKCNGAHAGVAQIQSGATRQLAPADWLSGVEGPLSLPTRARLYGATLEGEPASETTPSTMTPGSLLSLNSALWEIGLSQVAKAATSLLCLEHSQSSQSNTNIRQCYAAYVRLFSSRQNHTSEHSSQIQ